MPLYCENKQKEAGLDPTFSILCRDLSQTNFSSSCLPNSINKKMLMALFEM